MQHLKTLGDGGPRAAGALNGHVAKVAIGAQSALPHQIGHLQDFASQTDEQNAAEIGVAGIAFERAHQGVITLIHPRHAAARIMNDGHKPIDIGHRRQDWIFLGSFGDEPRD